MPSIITPKSAIKMKQKSVSFKVSEDIYDDLQALKIRVKKYSNEVDFNLDLVMADALQKNITAAKKHLDTLDKSSDLNSENSQIKTPDL